MNNKSDRGCGALPCKGNGLARIEPSSEADSDRKRYPWLTAGNLAQQRWLRFCLVGAIGFAVDGLVLAILYHGFGSNALAARTASFSFAVVVTWLLNRAYTFGVARKGPAHLELLRYLAVNGLGLAVNMGVYSVAVTASSFLGKRPLIALALAAVLAAIANYIGAVRFAYASRQG